MKPLTLRYDNAQLLLRLIEAHADSLEFDIAPRAQQEAIDAWLLGGRISEVMESAEPEQILSLSDDEAVLLLGLVREYSEALVFDIAPLAQRHAFDSRYLVAKMAELLDPHAVTDG
jgi:hypothetical protein